MAAYFISAENQAGELIARMDDRSDMDQLVAGEIGEVLTGRCAGRTHENTITIYRSLGVAAQDIYAAHYLCSQ